MMHYIQPDSDLWTALKVAAALVPAVIFLWVIATVMVLHKRDVYFWRLGSTWTTIIGCPAGLVIASFSALGGNDPNSAPLYTPLIAGLALYAVAFAYSISYNYGVTKSASLAISTSMLQQLAVLGLVLLFLRWQGDQVNRRR